MWALPVLRTSYLAVEFHARAATLASLSPCDLYSVNLGSVVGCETSIRPPLPRASVILQTSRAAASALEWKRWQVVAGAATKGIRRMRDLYRAGGAVRGAGCFRKRWQLPSTPGVILPQATASYVSGEPVFSVHRSARHTLVKPEPTREVAANKLLFLPNKPQSHPRSPSVINTLKQK